ncbi:DUF4350 domain-containing protein [Brevundimonas sp.]|uniref:DUF4350 domain-containing protein n=1 Tax=Brevundimonas sp. TaxID=1871086 RepID=UPI0025F70117|nr:DUF4350 domain-containing protein [Brevundimonas sp.]
MLRFVFAMAWLVFATPALAQQQMADPDWVPRVGTPTWPAEGPVVVIDEAHANFHTAGGRYAPFADLLRADGYRVAAGTSRFTDASLASVSILVIANAGSPNAGDAVEPAFTEDETAAIERWVRNGGSLFLIADHAPFGLVAQSLAARFGVAMGTGWAFERAPDGPGLTANIDYSRADGDLGSHPTTEGVERVRSFGGQSLTGPAGSTVLMRLADEAWEAPDRAELTQADAALRATGDGSPNLDGLAVPVGGRAQALAFEHGRGRVVVFGEAGMFSAQVVRFPPEQAREDIRFGMNVPGLHNDRLALGVMRWLSRAGE